MKGKVFTHVEQHFAPLDNILEGLKAEKHSSVWRDQGLKERAVLTTKIWETWLQKAPLERGGQTKISFKQANRNIPSWKGKKRCTFQAQNVSFMPVCFKFNHRAEQRSKTFLKLVFIARFYFFFLKSATWLALECLYLRNVVLDLNIGNPEKLTDMPHLNSLDLSCDMKLCRTTHRSRKGVYKFCFLGLTRLLGSATGVWRCSWGLCLLSYRFLSAFNLLAANQKLKWSYLQFGFHPSSIRNKFVSNGNESCQGFFLFPNTFPISRNKILGCSRSEVKRSWGRAGFGVPAFHTPSLPQHLTQAKSFGGLEGLVHSVLDWANFFLGWRNEHLCGCTGGWTCLSGAVTACGCFWLTWQSTLRHKPRSDPGTLWRPNSTFKSKNRTPVCVNLGSQLKMSEWFFCVSGRRPSWGGSCPFPLLFLMAGAPSGAHGQMRPPRPTRRNQKVKMVKMR